MSTRAARAPMAPFVRPRPYGDQGAGLRPPGYLVSFRRVHAAERGGRLRP